MKPATFKKIKIEPAVDKIQENIARKMEEYDNQPFIKGVLLSSVALTTSDTVINHSLGTTPQGWLILDRNANATVWRTAAFNELTLTLRASASVTVNIWVF